VPAVLFQARDTKALTGFVLGLQDLQPIAFGDLRFLAKVRILRQQDLGVDLAIEPAVTVPTGFPLAATGNYIGEGQITVAPELLLSRHFDDGALQGLKLAANVGFRYRPEKRQFVNVTVGNEITWRAGVGYRLTSLPMELGLTLNGATSADTPFTSGLEENPLEVMGGVAYDLAPFLTATAGVGKGILSGFGTPDFRALVGLRFQIPTENDRDHDGIPDSADKCPDQPEDKDGFEDSDGCPDLDNDHDGIPDTADKCPNEAEDFDGFEDQDGCPDPDNDKDGILDVNDKCPNEAGPASNQGCPIADRDHDGIVDSADKCPDVPGIAALEGCPEPDADGDGIPDKDDVCPKVKGVASARGCPDSDGDGVADLDDKCPTVPGLKELQGCPETGTSTAKLSHEKIELLDKVYFDVDQDRIQTRSFPLLDQVANIMKAHPELNKMRVEGHTDNDNTPEHNQDLSDRRAKAVLKYLVDKGVEAKRLEAKGYGLTKPVVPNTSAANKEKNRRVEFVIVEIDGKPVDTTTIKSNQ
jgi:outer membrane protein OmpA-like peptidoglycan-associated protein